MGVENLQSWADNLETIRLPKIEADVSQLRADQNATQSQLSAKVQEFTDSFAAHSSRILANVNSILLARGEADHALGRIYSGDFEVKAYIDMRVQQIRNEFAGSVAGLHDYISGDLATELDASIDTRTAALVTRVNQSVLEVEAVRDTITADVDDIRTVSAEILNTALPGQANRLASYEESLAGLQSEVDQVLAGFDYDSLMDGIFDVQSRAADSLAPLGLTVLREPASVWTTDPTGALLSPKVPIPSSWLIRDDVIGDCARLPLGTDQAISRSYPDDFAPDRVYRVRVRVRAVNSGSLGGVRLALGVSTWAGGVPAELGVEKEVTVTPLTGGDLDQVFTCLFSADLAKLEAQDYAIGTAPTDVALHLSGSGSANQAFFHVRQNPGGLSDGQLLVGILEVKDVTEALDVAEIIRTQMDAKLGENIAAEIDEIKVTLTDLDSAVSLVRSDLTAELDQTNSNLTTFYYTIAQTDTAISGAITDLKAVIEDPEGSSIGARLTTEFYTIAQTDQAVSSRISDYDALVAGGLTATVSSHETAIANLNGFAQSMVGFRAQAGNQVSLLDLVAYDGSSGGGSSYSLARISADNILLDGTVAAQKLVVTDFSGNLILNGAIPYGDARGWGPMPTTFAIVPRDPNSPYDAVKTALSPYILHMSPNTSHRFVVVGEFTCEAGETFATQYNAASAVDQGCNIGIQFVWIGADGQETSTSRSTVINYSGWQKIVTPAVTAPEGTVKCILRAIRWGDSSASIGLLSNMEVVKQRSGSVLITPGSISADDIQAGRMNARHLEVTELLEMDAENAGFVLSKRAVLDTTDGVYMGAVGEHGFGFAASRTTGAIRQSVTLDPINGFVLRNARHRVTGATLPQSATVTASKTIDLPTGTKSLSLMLLGGGGGGASGSWGDEGIIRGNGANGGATIVQLYDGPTLVGTYEAPGGVGATEGTSGNNGGDGESSSYGKGGSKGTSSSAPTAGSGQGAGGGGGYGLYGRGGKGGKAGSQINRDLDVSLLTAPRLVITIGAPGVGGIPTGTTNTKVRGAAGSAGRVAYTHSAFTDIPADVIPLKPTSVGSFAKAADATGSTIFPDLGPGLWILDAANSTLVIGTIEIDNQGTLIHANSALNVTFFASKRPRVVSGVGTARTIRYAFYSMGNWG